MLYILGIVAVVVGAGWGLTGLLSLKSRDEHAIKNYSGDIYAQQSQMYHQDSNSPF